MSLFNIFEIAGSAMGAQGQRLNTVASNIANAESTAGPDGKVYRAKQVVFESVPGAAPGSFAVKVQQVVENQAPARMVHNPAHPQANADGFVAMPNVNVVEQMVDMISASRSYQTNVETMNAAKTMLLKTLTLGQ
ncbi:MAG TPA: flagellar basal body rod protein FlgC [Noviherbaspirillum sp.]